MVYKIVGIIDKINGNVVKKDVLKGTEHSLKNGDLIMLDDSVWLRSLDACAEIILCQTVISLKVGMRIKFDSNYLNKVKSYAFFHQSEIDKILIAIQSQNDKKINSPEQKKVTYKDTIIEHQNQQSRVSINTSFENSNECQFKIVKNFNVDIKNTDVVNLQIDNMAKNNIFFNTYATVYDNSNNPSFKFNVDKKIIPKIFILGFEEFILEEPKELQGVIYYDEDSCIFACSSSFVVAGEYTLYVRFMSLDDPNLIKELFFRLGIKFDNDDIPKLQSISDGKIYGSVDKGGALVGLYECEIGGNFNKLIETHAAPNGKFIINLNTLKNANLQSLRLCIRSTDIYGNQTVAVPVRL